MGDMSSAARNANDAGAPVRMLMNGVTKRAMQNVGAWYDIVINLTHDAASAEFHRLTSRRPRLLRPEAEWRIRKERRPNGWALQVCYEPSQTEASQ